MRGLVFDGPGAIRYADDLADPSIDDPNDAIVDVQLAGLCGSDLHPYEAREPCAAGVVPGHEAMGLVSAVGSQVTLFRPGDRVIVPFTVSCGSCDRCLTALSSRCRSSRLFGWGDPAGEPPPLHGCQAERVRVPLADGTLVRLPDTIDDVTALLLSDNFPTAWYAVGRTDWTSGALAIIGLGAVGLCAVAAAQAMGVDEIVGVDPIPERRQAAEGMGAATAAPDEIEGTFAAVVEAAGPTAAQHLAASIAAPGATISIIAVQTAPAFGIDPVAAYDRNLTIRTGRAPVRSSLDRILDDVAAGTIAVPTESIVTHPDRPLESGPDLYRAFAAREEGFVKATFRTGS